MFLVLALLLLAAVSTGCAESWSINQVASHYMGSNSGLPGGFWPSGSAFNTSFSFQITLNEQLSPPSNLTVDLMCEATWAGNSFPSDWQACSFPDDHKQASSREDEFFWKFTHGTVPDKGVFGLQLVHTTLLNRTTIEVASANFSTTSNNQTDPISYLTCLTSAPLQGVNCTTGGGLSSKKLPSTLHVVTNMVDVDPLSISSLEATPSTKPSDPTDCRGFFWFELSGANPANCSIEWPCTAGEPVADQMYHCTSGDYRWSISREDDKSIFSGFTLVVSQEYNTTLNNAGLTLNVSSALDLALGAELKADEKDCASDGRCKVEAGILRLAISEVTLATN